MNDEEFVGMYHGFVRKRVLLVAVCIVVAVFLLLLNVSVGLYGMSVSESYGVLMDYLRGIEPSTFEEYRRQVIVVDQRLPRAIAGLAVGAILGVCGATMQSCLKNPLADPYTTGISSGAGLGVSIVVIAGLSFPGFTHEMDIALGAFLFSLIPTAVILLLSGLKRVSTTAIILSGVAVMYIFGGITTMLKLIAEPEDLSEVYQWGLGNLGSAEWSSLPYMVVACIICTVSMMMLNGRLNILAMNDECVTSLGINPRRMRTVVLIVVSLSTALAVCFVGTIGFVGLVAPHIVRMAVGSDNRLLIPASAAFGGMFLLLADTAAKIAGPTDLPVGVITSLVGGPLFLYILIRQRRRIWT